MTPVIPCSIGNICLLPVSTFTSKKDNRLTKCKVFGKYTRPKFCSQWLFLHQPISAGLFHKYRFTCSIQNTSRIQMLSATGTDVAVEESNNVAEGEDANETSEVLPDAVGTNETSSVENAGPAPVQSKRLRPSRKSEMPPVKNEELIPGATFTGKVRSILPFGAFVDFGAFTDGLVHVSQISDSFVKDIGSLLSVGQEVTVRLVEADLETGRISLTMRASDDNNKQLQKDSHTNRGSDKPRPARKSNFRPNERQDVAPTTSEFVEGQVLVGTVKNQTSAGAFISLPEGEEGFLPTSEEPDGFLDMMGGSSLQVGQEVNVRVLRITRGQVTLTMKKEIDDDEPEVILDGVVHIATNPFELAFRKNKAIAAFLDERWKAQKAAGTLRALKKTSIQIDGKIYQTEMKSDTKEKMETDEKQLVEDDIPSSTVNVAIDEAPIADGVTEDAKISDVSETPEKAKGQVDQTDTESDALVNDEVQTEAKLLEDETPEKSEGKVEQTDTLSDALVNDKVETEAKLPVVDDMPSASANLVSEEVSLRDEMENKATLLVDEEKPSSTVNTVIDEASTTDGVEEDSKEMDSRAKTADQISSSESTAPDEAALSQADDALLKDKVDTEAQSLVDNEVGSTSKEEEKATSSIPKENGSATLNGQANVPSVQESTPTAASISAALVKQLREETGAGMMDCKKALSESGGDIVKAQEFLRKKGLASADKKASRTTAEGRIGSYVHDNRIGVLIEVNCETDFVSRGDIFKELVDDLAMQVAACPQVQYLVTEDVPEEIVNKEREIEMQKEDLLNKPEQIRGKIVDGRIQKRLSELALLEQAYIKNDKVAVKDWVKQIIATIGENIKVKRFVRYNLGEGLEKKSQDFAAEVAAQTAAKPPPAPPKDQTVGEEAEETMKPQTVAVSAALVKQLREETGAGMMDCKKALSETGGDIEKAQEYLRKKGLSTADKKSSRLAAEGRIASYIHDSRIGVLIEVNCETDFVGRSEKFKELVDDLAMQVVACPQVQFVSVEDIPESITSKERELEMQREDLLLKPENIRARIVDGRVVKRLAELSLLEQPFIKDDSILIKDLVKQTVATLGENIKVRRFVRFTLGEEASEDAKP